MSEKISNLNNLSLAKSKINILLLEGVSESACELFSKAGYTNIKILKQALNEEQLAKELKSTHILGIRSRTQITANVINNAPMLLAIGCFCIGTNQVDLLQTAANGIPVFNAPFSNTRSVAELVIGEIVMLLRQVIPKSSFAHQGIWDKSATNSFEVRGKTLGIVGYGNIGSQLSVLAEAFGMHVIYYDTITKLRHGNSASTNTLKDLLTQSDVVSLHVPELESTNNLIGALELAQMKKGSYLINNSRGNVVDINALKHALETNHLFGAALDVFPQEPQKNGDLFVCSLQGLNNVILTPHIGGSTGEAQERIGEEVAKKLIDYSDSGATLGAVNFPEINLPARAIGTRFMHVHANSPGILSKITNIFFDNNMNVCAQYFQTLGELGYIVIDVQGDRNLTKEILKQLKSLPGTVRARLLYER